MCLGDTIKYPSNSVTKTMHIVISLNSQQFWTDWVVANAIFPCWVKVPHLYCNVTLIFSQTQSVTHQFAFALSFVLIELEQVFLCKFISSWGTYSLVFNPKDFFLLSNYSQYHQSLPTNMNAEMVKNLLEIWHIRFSFRIKWLKLQKNSPMGRTREPKVDKQTHSSFSIEFCTYWKHFNDLSCVPFWVFIRWTSWYFSKSFCETFLKAENSLLHQSWTNNLVSTGSHCSSSTSSRQW